jgi:hypothetical protein
MSVIPPRPAEEPVMPVAPATVPELGETLRVVNVSEQDTYRFAWNSRQYTVGPGMSEFMPFDAVKVYAGDPRATNNVRTSRDTLGIVSFLPDRATEVRRLRLLYSAPFGEYMRASDVGGIFVHTADPSDAGLASRYAWDGVKIPRIEVFNIRGERIYTVLDDPEGMLSIPVAVTRHQVDRSDQLARLVEQQTSIIEALSARLGIDPHSPALDNSPDVTDEEPPPEPEVHADGTPQMVYDTRDETVKPRIRRQKADPTDINDLPEDPS